MLQTVAGAQYCKVQFYDDLTEYQVVSEYIAKKKTISPVVEGRIVATTKNVLSKDLAKETGLPTDYQLMQNSPNPFNPTTTIEFSIPKNENVVLRIYNTLGQVMETLVNENMNAGVYKYTWAPKNLASGIYIYQISAGKFSQAKKLILMK
jgi:flagellar hook assembly protein FlgD